MLDNKDLNIAIHAARTAGKILKENFRKKYHVVRKSPKEMVSEIDLQSQRAIMDTLSMYNHDYSIITEEKRFTEKRGGKTWIIDPIDGTHNYIAGLPFSSVSIALADEGIFYLGVIYFPIEDELYHAVRGQGSFCNGEPISVSKNDSLSKAVVNYDNQFHLSDKSFDYYKVLTEKAFTTRIFGVATKDLCLIASGKIDGRIWLNTKICDIAAGSVILSEAGGAITNSDGSAITMDPNQVVASNRKVHDELLAIFKERGK